MALPFSLFFKGIGIYGPGKITFDLVLSENHNFDSEITTHPVEDGSEITDHIQNELDKGDITGFISNYSLFAPPLVSNRAQDVFNALVALWESRELFTMTTILKTYEDVAISSMPVTLDEDSSDSLIFQISFKKIKIVTLQEVALEAAVSVKGLELNLDRQIAPEYEAGTILPA